MNVVSPGLRAANDIYLSTEVSTIDTLRSTLSNDKNTEYVVDRLNQCLEKVVLLTVGEKKVHNQCPHSCETGTQHLDKLTSNRLYTSTS